MIQVLLVTEGLHYQGGTWTSLDSTEIMETSGGSWRTLTTATLPSARYALHAGTANNTVTLFGKSCLHLLIYLFIYNLRNQLRNTGIGRSQVTTRLTGRGLAALRIFFSRTLSDPLLSSPLLSNPSLLKRVGSLMFYNILYFILLFLIRRK